MEATDTTTWDLAGLFAVLRRRLRWIAGSAVLAVLVAVALSFVATPVYRSTAEVLIEPDVATTDPDALGRVAFLDQELQTQLRLMQSEAIAARVAERLSLGVGASSVLSRIQAGVLPDTRVIRVVASDTDPDRAAQLAQAVSDEYLAFRREDASERLQEAKASLQQRLDRVQTELDRLDDAIASTDEPARASTLRIDRENAADEAAILEAQLNQLEAADPIARGGGRVIQTAQVPASPSEPDPVRDGIVALVLGLGVGIVLALVVDNVDDAVYSADAAGMAAGRPVLGRIPLASEDEGGELPVLRAHASPPAEAFRDLRTNLRFVGASGPPGVVVVTSSIQGEGKSVVSANLALAAAAAGRRVVLIDADLRRPAQGGIFGQSDVVGLSSVLVREHGLEDVLFTIPDTGLDLLFAGDRPPNPSELLSGERLGSMVAALRGRYDLVVIDTPPVLVVPDALEITAFADATLLVAELGRTGRREIGEATERLVRAAGQVSGLVVNRADLDTAPYYYYTYE